MKKVAVLIVLLIAVSTFAASRFTIIELQGAWWSDLINPTADFAITGNQVWLDYDSQYHPCRVDDDVLIFDLGEELGYVKNKIISLKGDRLVLEDQGTKKRITYIRAKQ